VYALILPKNVATSKLPAWRSVAKEQDECASMEVPESTADKPLCHLSAGTMLHGIFFV
jgi:hypothetical protein